MGDCVLHGREVKINLVAKQGEKSLEKVGQK